MAFPEFRSKVLPLFARMMGAPNKPGDYVNPERLLSNLDDVMVEMYDGQLKENIQKLHSSSSQESVFQLMSYSIYLSSNNLLSEYETDEITTVVRKLKVLGSLLDLNTPTTITFVSNLFSSAVRLGYNDLVRIFLDKGFQVNAAPPRLSGKRNEILEELLTAKESHNPLFSSDVASSERRIPTEFDPNQGMNDYVSVWRYSISHHADHVLRRGADSVEMVKLLVKGGADVDKLIKVGSRHYGILAWAIQSCDEAMIPVLIDAGAHPNGSIYEECTPLRAAVDTNQPDVAQALIDAGADANAPIGEIFKEFARLDFQPLSLATQITASQLDWTESAQILMRNGSMPSAFPYTGYVIDEELEELPEHLDETCPCWGNERSGCLMNFPLTALQSAVKDQNYELVSTLLKEGSNSKERGVLEGKSPLQLAVASNNADIVQLLLKHSADINTPANTYNGKTILQAAAGTGNCQIVRQLLIHGANVNAAPGTYGGRTALQAAAEKGHIEVAKLLIDYGANVRAKASPRQGVTCLEAAVLGGDLKLVLCLLEKGADANEAAAASGGE